MNTFYQLVHKQTSITDAVYNFPTHETINNKSFEYTNIAWKNEYKHPDIKERVVKLLFDTMVMLPLNQSVQTKFSYLKTVLDNVFMCADQKEKFLIEFSKAQRKYRILTRLVQNYKWRKAPFQIKHDLFLNPISESAYDVITILQNNNKYLFTVGDLKNIIATALSNSPFFFAEPIPAKNPYNNMPFDKATLYNIYFFMKTRLFVLSPLIHEYFLCNFHLRRFRDNNEVTIRRYYIEHHLNGMNIHEICKDVRTMLLSTRIGKKIYVDKDFPEDKLATIMKPYLKLYYTLCYSLDMADRHRAQHELIAKLKEFYEFNIRFGRKYVTRGKNNIPSVITFDDKHIKFVPPNYSKDYKNTHLEIVEEDCDCHNEDVRRDPSESDEETDDDE